MKKTLILAAALLVLIAVGFFGRNALPCVATGGAWERVGKSGRFACIHPYPDGGKPCASSDECAGRCLVTNSGEGFCERTDSPFGCSQTIEAFNAGDSGRCVD